jgi:hypothetical protein
MTELRFAELLVLWVIFGNLSKVFIVVYWFNCMNLFNLYKFSGIFKYFRHFKNLWRNSCVFPLIDHGSRPMKSHEFLRLLYKALIYRLFDKHPNWWHFKVELAWFESSDSVKFIQTIFYFKTIFIPRLDGQLKRRVNTPAKFLCSNFSVFGNLKFRVLLASFVA